MPQTNVIPILFPMGGINRGGGFGNQPEGTCYDALNVRPHDALLKRRRGGRRTGIAKYFADPINGTNPIQGLGGVVLAYDPSTVVADELIFSEEAADYTIGANIDDAGSSAFKETCNPATDGRLNADGFFGWTCVDSGGVKYFAANHSLVVIHRGLIIRTPLSLGPTYVVRITMLPPGASATSSNKGSFGVVVRANPSILTDAYVSTDNQYISTGFVGGTASPYTATVRLTNTPNDSAWSSEGTTVGTHTFNSATECIFELRVNGNYFQVWVDGVQVGATLLRTDFSSFVNIAVIAGPGALGTKSPLIRKVEVFSGAALASLRSTKIVAVSGGTIYSGPASTQPAAATSGTGMITAGRVAIQPAFQKVYFCDGYASGYKVLDPATNTVSTWTPTAGTLPVGSSDATKACRLMALYRGRIVLAGLQEDPQNWYMTKAGDPLDLNYSPTPSNATQAVAGNSPEGAGLLGDVVTAIIPYQDDLCFFGGDHTLWVLRGDPAAGGQIDNISRQVGVVGPDAFTWDFSRLYFLSQTGLYRLEASGGNLEKIDKGRLDDVFDSIDYATNEIRLVYDRSWQGVHIFITPVNEPAQPVDHWFWDERTDSFWRDQYPTPIGPTAVHLYDADDPDDRAVLMGGYDGYVRHFSDSAKTDDGAAISSFVQFTPWRLEGDLYAMRLHAMQIALAASSNDLLLSLYAGDNQEEAMTAISPVFTATVSAGRNPSIVKRARGNAMMLKASHSASNETWAWESGLAFIQQAGRILSPT